MGTASPQESLDQVDTDRMKSAYGIVRFGTGAFVADVGLGWHDYTKEIGNTAGWASV